MFIKYSPRRFLCVSFLGMSLFYVPAIALVKLQFASACCLSVSLGSTSTPPSHHGRECEREGENLQFLVFLLANKTASISDSNSGPCPSESETVKMSGRKGFMWIEMDGEGTLAEQMDRVIHHNQYKDLVRSNSFLQGRWRP